MLTFLKPIQKLYQSLGHLSFSKKHSSMWVQSSPINPERNNDSIHKLLIIQPKKKKENKS